jgi:histone deacetylase 11
MTTHVGRLPVVYHPSYNIGLCGIENVMHSFDTKKYGKISSALQSHFHIPSSRFQSPDPLDEEDLLLVHTKEYLESLNRSSTIASVAEVPPLSFFPHFILRQSILEPMKLATSGTILAGKLALEHGWAINLSGGYHHAKPHRGEGFCFFADIPLAIKKLPVETARVLVVDLDAHQGNGFQSIFAAIGQDEQGRSEVEYVSHPEVAILDMYNQYNYPRDSFAKGFITYDGAVSAATSESQYFDILNQLLPQALTEHQPQIVFYNAGTDIYEKDPLGGLNISADGIVRRDELVFRSCRDLNIPIAMVLSGGYTSASAGIITSSIINLHDKGLIHLE